jgi:hypothetical protein
MLDYIKQIEELQEQFIDQFQNSFEGNFQSNRDSQMKAWQLNADYLVELLKRQNNFCMNVVNSSFNIKADGDGIKANLDKNREYYINALKDLNEANLDSMNNLFVELGDLDLKVDKEK